MSFVDRFPQRPSVAAICQSSGVASIVFPAASSTSSDIVIAHGLTLGGVARTPTNVQLTAVGGFGATDGPVLWVTSLDATNIHVRCQLVLGHQPGAGTYGQVYWFVEG